jgi:hypothetical protein
MIFEVWINLKTKMVFYSLHYTEFVVPLVQAVQQQQVIDLLQKQGGATRAGIPVQMGKQQTLIIQQQKVIGELKKGNHGAKKMRDAFQQQIDHLKH